MEYLVVARGELLDLTDGGTVGRDPGHEPTWLDVDGIDDVIDVTLRVCPDCGDDLGQATQVTTRLIEEIPEPPPIDTIQYNLHQYSCDGCDSTVEATHSDCPPEGNFGVNVLAQAAHARYECRLPYRKIADRFPDLLGLKLSDASAWYCVQRVAEAGRDGYEAILAQIREADVVHVNETGQRLDGDQGWLWTFKTEEAILYEIATSRGSEVIDEVLGEDFDGHLVNDG